MRVNSTLYDQDFYAWSHEQAALLRAGHVSEADLANIAEEIESMGRSERRELVSRLVVLLLHLAKWRFQPGWRGRSWRLSIQGRRIDISQALSDIPSLKPQLTSLMQLAWRRALIEAQRETGLEASTFPADCPWTAEQALNDAFLPE